MRCIVTGIETENKFQNIPICTSAIKAAKQYQEITPGISLKDALKKLHKDFVKMAREKANEADSHIKVIGN